MFIYKITIIPSNQIYIGLDTKPIYKQSRWREHCRDAFKRQKNRKLHNAMREFGIDQCIYEVIEDKFNSIGQLALAEISYIQKFNSYKNGLNSTPGGDGLGRADLSMLTDFEIQSIRKSLGESFTEYNQKKWANTTSQDRKVLTKHLHTEEIYKRKSETLKNFYKTNPDVAKKKAEGIKKWQQSNQQQLKERNQINSYKGAAKVSKKLLVEFPDGSVLNYPSKSEFLRQTGLWSKTILEKTSKGLSHNGYKAWEL